MSSNIKISTTNVSLILISIFIITGNLGRITPSFNITELSVLFIFSTTFFFKRMHTRILLGLLSLILLIVFSMLVGIIKFSFNSDGIFYSLRLIIQLLSIFSISYTLLKYEQTGSYFPKIIQSYINIYVYLSIISIIILLVFPNSVNLWSFLRKFGIFVDGDPHLNRIVSTYFDPNFFGNILLFPFLLLMIQLKHFPSKKNVTKFMLFAFTLIFTFSRSTIASMTLLLLLYFSYQIYISTKTGHLSKKIMYLATLFFITIPIILSNSYISDRIIQRFSSTSSNDGSTMARIESYSIGNRLFFENPILGSGYNFTLSEQRILRGGIGIDSSIQSILIGFGIIGTLILFIVFLIYIYSIYSKYKVAYTYEKEVAFFYITYLLLSIFFLSNFNQLIFYPFWIIPILSFGIYLIIRKS